MIVHTATQPSEGMNGDVYAANQLDWMSQTESNETLLQTNLMGLRDLFGDGFISGSGASDTFVAIGSGLQLDVIAHKALIGTVVTITGTQHIAIAPSQTDLFVWEWQTNSDDTPDYTTTADDTNPDIADGTRFAQLLGMVSTDASAITSFTPLFRILSVVSNKRLSEVGTTWDSTTGSDGTDTSFALTYARRPDSEVSVFDNGLKRIPTTHYTLAETPTLTVNFVSGFYPLAGHSVEVVYEPL